MRTVRRVAVLEAPARNSYGPGSTAQRPCATSRYARTDSGTVKARVAVSSGIRWTRACVTSSASVFTAAVRPSYPKRVYVRPWPKGKSGVPPYAVHSRAGSVAAASGTAYG